MLASPWVSSVDTCCSNSQLRSSRWGLRPTICERFTNGLGHEPRDKTRSTAPSTIERNALSPLWIGAANATFRMSIRGATSSTGIDSVERLRYITQRRVTPLYAALLMRLMTAAPRSPKYITMLTSVSSMVAKSPNPSAIPNTCWRQQFLRSRQRISKRKKSPHCITRTLRSKAKTTEITLSELVCCVEKAFTIESTSNSPQDHLNIRDVSL